MSRKDLNMNNNSILKPDPELFVLHVLHSVQQRPQSSRRQKMNFSKNILLFLIILLISIPEQSQAIPAFPGAEGFGAETIGGRGGTVIKVTNLNDSGAGSLRAAVETSGARIVVFETSGIINLQKDLDISNPYITIAGQTSPGGILITGWRTKIITHDVIIQHIRFRVGSHQITNGADPEQLDALDIWGKYWGPNEAYNIIIDHCSISWGVDETFSISGGVMNTTVQWSIISEGLSSAGHPKGEHSKGLMVSGKYVYPNTLSLHHNYIAHNSDRSPFIYSPDGVDTIVDYVNNITYNWKGSLSPLGGGTAKINWVYNYSKQGSASNDWSFEVTHDAAGISPSSQLYVLGNIGSSRLTQDAPHWNVGRHFYNELLDTAWQKTTPWNVPPVTIRTMTESVANCILTSVGATAPVRDSVDTRVVADFAAETGKIIDNVTYPDDFPTFKNLPSPADTDNDGMADSWEVTEGLNTKADDSNQDKDNDGYTNIEEYLHYLSAQSYTYNTDCMPVPIPNIKNITAK